jgi:hypothetical protein
MKFILRFFRPLIRAINEADQIHLLGAINDAFDAAQAWFRISPYGDFPVTVTVDGRKKRVIQRVDRKAADEMVAGFNSLAGRTARLFRGLPIYIGHPDDPEWLAKHPGTPTSAQGRIKELQAREDGLWGRHAMNEAGAALISGEGAPFDSQSPHFGLLPVNDTVCRPMKLFSIGLTNNPNIPDTAIGINEAMPAEQFPMKEQLLKLLAALGFTVAADSDETKVTTAVNEALPKATAAVAAQGELSSAKSLLTAAVNEKSAMQTQLTTATNEAAAAKAAVTAEREARTEIVLTRAVNEGRISQAQRPEWKGKLIAATDFSATETELGNLKKAVNTKSAVADLGARKGEQAASSETIRAINEAVAEKEKKGLNHFDAFQAVRKEKPDLFSASAD